MSREAVTQFVEHLKSDPDLIAMVEKRPQDKQANLADALDHAVRVAAERGFQFSSEELSQALLEQPSPQQSPLSNEELQMVAGGLSFSSIRVGLHNPTRVMCQCHAPMILLRSIR